MSARLADQWSARGQQPSRRNALTAALAMFVFANGAIAQGAGAWSGPWDWSCQVLGYPVACPAPPVEQTCSNGIKCTLLEFSHASLIPVGLHQGKVLMWRNESLWCCSGPASATTETWLFDPQSPTQLIKIEHPTLAANLFCAGHSWDERGRLVVGGGPTTRLFLALSTYRFVASALGAVDTSGVYPVIPTPSGSPWVQLNDFARERWYPTLLTLNDEPIPPRLGQVTCATFTTPSGATLAFGGAFDQTPNRCHVWDPTLTCDNCPHCYKGSAVWERLAGVNWKCPLTPAVNYDGVQSVPSDHELYEEDPTVPPPAPPPVFRYLDSYPRAFQLSVANGKEIFVAFDTSSYLDQPNASAPRQNWAMKAPYPSLYTGSPQNWELVEGRQPEPALVGSGDGDRYYGNAVLMHTRNESGQPVHDRVIVLNGKQQGAPASAPHHPVIREFIPNGNPGFTPIWQNKATITDSRLFGNAVILPTGEILVLGGKLWQNGSAVCVTQPYLVDVGDLPVDPAVVTPLPATSNPHPRTGVPTERLYHSTSVLLPDGRVFLVGGDDEGHDSCNAPGMLAASYSGEIYSPPYMFAPWRPHIDIAPGLTRFSVPSTLHGLPRP